MRIKWLGLLKIQSSLHRKNMNSRNFLSRSSLHSWDAVLAPLNTNFSVAAAEASAFPLCSALQSFLASPWAASAGHSQEWGHNREKVIFSVMPGNLCMTLFPKICPFFRLVLLWAELPAGGQIVAIRRSQQVCLYLVWEGNKWHLAPGNSNNSGDNHSL